MPPLHILVTGSRSWADEKTIAATLFATMSAIAPRPATGALRDPIELTHGACHDPDTGALTGADGIADAIGHAAGWTVLRRPADWYGPCDPGFCHHGPRRTDRHGRDYCPAAGPRRNAAMVEEFARRTRATGAPAIALAFPQGKSSGTRGCVKLIERAGITLRVVDGWVAA